MVIINLEKYFNLILKSKKIVFFGGAGTSTASGIPDFRSADGLYNQKNTLVSPEQIISHSFFLKDPKTFFDFYFSKMVYMNAKPNHCHIALSKLEKQNKLLSVITQNIDGLHQLAGSKNVLELHGSIWRNYSFKTNQFYTLNEVLNLRNKDGIPINKSGEIIKPDVVLYEEALNQETIIKAIKDISNADLLIIGGTSLTVYPAAGFINYYRGKDIIVINKSKLEMQTPNQLNMDIDLFFKEFLNYVKNK